MRILLSQIGLDHERTFIRWLIGACGGVQGLGKVLLGEIPQGVAKLNRNQKFQTMSTGKVGKASGADAFRGRWSRAFKGDGDIDEIARVLRIIGPSIEIQTRIVPWDRLPSGKFTVHVALGTRPVDIPEVATSVRQRAVGYRDSEALASFMELLYRKMRLDCNVELHHASNEAAAAEKLARLKADPEAGMIVCLGSPVVNPFADPLCRMILDHGTPRTVGPPAKFLFSYSHPQWTLAASTSAQRNAWPQHKDKEGVGVLYKRDNAFFERVPDDQIWRSIPPIGDLNDAGILMMDIRHRPMLILCAGHGGCGTRAAVEQLGNSEVLSDLIAYFEGDSDLRERICAVIEVKRKFANSRESAATGKPIDNLEIGSHRIVWPEL